MNFLVSYTCIFFARITIQLFIGTPKMSILFFFQIETVYYLFSPFFPTFSPATSKIYFHHCGVRQNKKKPPKLFTQYFFHPNFAKFYTCQNAVPQQCSGIVFQVASMFHCLLSLFVCIFSCLYINVYINSTYERQKRFLYNPLVRVILKSQYCSLKIVVSFYF